ncbi:hypothetical protein [Frankia sp. AgB32]|uniref:hypothetical protein n=1 Tax=Frankia sp. AgB32 TaxID=631119 RepID=UPI00200F7B9A|nr:hypothetical protein [Frankia sp. AgB32]MCK9895426.1 hypothetical protein [Frankia sp. AgB32]
MARSQAQRAALVTVAAATGLPGSRPGHSTCSAKLRCSRSAWSRQGRQVAVYGLREVIA